MQLGQKLNIRHSQSIVMTPQLRQAIKLLQFSNQELTQYVEDEMEKNPFLDKKQLNKIDKNDVNISVDKTEDSSAAMSSGESMKDDPALSDIENRWDEDRSYSTNTKRNNISNEDLSSIENRIAGPKKNLRDHLLEQILLDIPKGEERNIAFLLLDVIEPSGWINTDLKIISEKGKVSIESVNNVLFKLQKMDPCGVFARNLGECLKIQLEENGDLSKENLILTENLQLLAKGEIKKLCKITSFNEVELSESINIIKKLNPKPGEGFEVDRLNIEPPDVMVTKSNKGWKVSLNKSTLPNLHVNEDFAGEIKGHNNNEDDKKYIGDAINSARWLMRAIEQRNNTTLKVAFAILKQQKEFFNKGPGHLKPLVLKDVADSIKMHESTVSRVTRSKLLQTPWGLFQMKDFFSGSINSTDQNKEACASKTVRETLKVIIDKEIDCKPYSDDDLSKIMKEKGVSVARRTVAKYREMMNIPSSAERRRLMRLNKVVKISIQ